MSPVFINGDLAAGAELLLLLSRLRLRLPRWWTAMTSSTLLLQPLLGLGGEVATDVGAPGSCSRTGSRVRLGIGVFAVRVAKAESITVRS
jgi:hypothetical protein